MNTKVVKVIRIQKDLFVVFGLENEGLLYNFDEVIEFIGDKASTTHPDNVVRRLDQLKIGGTSKVTIDVR